MKRLIAIAVLLATAACATPPATSFRVEWVDNPQAACDRTNVIGRVVGCAKRDGDTCVIYAQRPTSSNDTKRFVTLGHEMMHCAEGQWHDEFGRMLKVKNHG